MHTIKKNTGYHVTFFIIVTGLCLLFAAHVSRAFAAECHNWPAVHPEWIFCDDFENDLPLVGSGRYFEYGSDEGDFVLREGAGTNGSRGMRVLWQPDEVGAGGLKLGFGRNPSGYINKGIRPDEDFREIYYRMYLKMQVGWQGNPAKLSRKSSSNNLTALSAANCTVGDRPMLHSSFSGRVTRKNISGS